MDARPSTGGKGAVEETVDIKAWRADPVPSTGERESRRGSSSGVSVRLSRVLAIVDAVVWSESELDDGGGDLGFYHPRRQVAFG